jgi:hypothetical protein
MKIYVEGGGDTSALKTECRRGFTEFLKHAGLTGHLPKIVACGGRSMAFDKFSIAIQNNEPAVLLVDSETPVKAEYQQGTNTALWQPWTHLKNRTGDKWDKPQNATNADCHFMVQCMESWFLADREALKTFFGQGFNENALPSIQRQIETVEKIDIYQSLENATKGCKIKAKYGKGEHSFKLLAVIDPAVVVLASKWAKRFVDEVKNRQWVLNE